MDDNSRPPLEFANRVIRQFVDNLFGDSIAVIPEDYTTMRVVFRKLGGSWELVSRGDAKHIQRIVQVVQSWGSSQQKNRKVEEGY